MYCASHRTSTSTGSWRGLVRSGSRGCDRCRLWRLCPRCGARREALSPALHASWCQPWSG
eukprot:10229697-Alexandrium_andersonii.AAC.1